VISIGISPQVQSLSRVHASSSPPALAGRSVPGVVLWLVAVLGGMTTVVVGCGSDLQATSSSTTSAKRFSFIERAIVIETTEGTIRCDLDTGSRAFDIIAHTNYEGRAFFRTIPGVLVQTGSPTDDGSNGSQPRVAIETRDDDRVRLSVPGVLLLARYTPPPNRVDPDPPTNGDVIGPQLVIGLADMSHLAGTVTVAGACRDLDVVRRISEGRGARVIRVR
jgi:cyclophilin family peptidyl-prolyl cis-trans isomerase